MPVSWATLTTVPPLTDIASMVVAAEELLLTVTVPVGARVEPTVIEPVVEPLAVTETVEPPFTTIVLAPLISAVAVTAVPVPARIAIGLLLL